MISQNSTRATPTEPAETFPSVKQLNESALTSTPVNVDMWDPEELGGDDAYWSFWEAARCLDCRGIVVFGALGGGGRHRDLVLDWCACSPTCVCGRTCWGNVPATTGPTMTSWYGLGSQDLEDKMEMIALAIVDLPVCCVRVGDDYGLAVTSNGDVTTWDICEAFLRAGYYPPTHFARKLPLRDGQLSPKQQWIVAGCQIAIQKHMNLLREGIKHLRGRR